MKRLGALLAFYAEYQGRDFERIMKKFYPETPDKDEFAHVQFCAAVFAYYMMRMLEIAMRVETDNARRYHAGINIHEYKQLERELFKSWN